MSKEDCQFRALAAGHRSVATLVPRSVALLFVELQGHGVHAESLAGRVGPVVEDMPEVAFAVGADDLGAGHPVAAVLAELDGALLGDRKSVV